MAVFLATRPYHKICGGDNTPTGRNTYLLPVTWIGEGAERQPLILEKGKSIPLVVDKAPWQIAAENGAKGAPLTGNRVFEDKFETPEIDPLWIQLRTPETFWYRSAVGGRSGLEIEARPVGELHRPLDRFVSWRVVFYGDGAVYAVRSSAGEWRKIRCPVGGVLRRRWSRHPFFRLRADVHPRLALRLGGFGIRSPPQRPTPLQDAACAARRNLPRPRRSPDGAWRRVVRSGADGEVPLQPERNC